MTEHDLLEWIQPGFLALVPALAVALKLATDLLKRIYPQLQGNIVQSLVGVFALASSVVIVTLSGAFEDGATPRELAGVVVLAFIGFTGAVGVNEAVKDRNEDNLPRPVNASPVPPAEVPVEE